MRQKLSDRKVLQFTGFHRKLSWFCMESAIAQLKICRKNFRGSSKTCENHETFYHLQYACCCLACAKI